MKTKIRFLAQGYAICAFSVVAIIACLSSQASSAASSQQTVNFQSLANSDLVLMGPVARVEPSKYQVELLGQTVTLPVNQRSQTIDGLVGHMVTVYGSLNADGSIRVQSISELSSAEYVSGATQLYVKGLLTSVDAAGGIARIGNLSINYTGALYTLAGSELLAGKVASFGGAMYADATKFYAENGLVQSAVGRAMSLGQTGSDSVRASAIGQTGSDIARRLGQTGSDAIGQTGSDAIGQTGSDTARAIGQTGSDGTRASVL